MAIGVTTLALDVVITADGVPVISHDAVHFSNLSQQSLRRARALGLRVLPWTVNETTDMERLLDGGVDGLITDRPDHLRAWMQRRGMSLPPPWW